MEKSDTMIQQHLQSALQVCNRICNDSDIALLIKTVTDVCTHAYKNKKRIFCAGNGGSAADAQHIVAELVSRFYFDRPGLAAEALTVNTSTLTAIGNDYAYSRVFARQLEANATEGDIFFALSTSGNSENIIEALHSAKSKKVITVGFSGESGGKMKSLCDYCFLIPSTDTPHIQEAHMVIAHVICALIEDNLFSKNSLKKSETIA